MLEKAKDWINKAIKHFELELSRLQLWRANPALVEDIFVEQYGSLQAIKNIASTSTIDNQTLSIKPWDRNLVHPIAKAITASWKWLNPQTMADSVIIKIPPLTEDRRKDTAKIAKKLSEEAKISVRNVRWEELKIIKKAEADKKISEDECKKYEEDLQKIINDANKLIDEKTKKKEEDIMKI